MDSSLPLRVREYQHIDEDRIVQIEKSCSRELTPVSSIKRLYQIPPEGFVVAEVGSTIAGFLLANVKNNPDGNSMHLLTIGVDPLYRKNHIGSTLMNHTVTALETKYGIKKIELEVKANNIGAQNFYKRLGFEVSHIMKRYYRMRGYTEDAVFMYKIVRVI